MGVGSGFIGSGGSSYHKSETFTCSIPIMSGNRLTEQEFIASLMVHVEKEIVDSQATVSAQGDVGTSGFYFEYSQNEIKGQINIEGKLIGHDYLLSAELEEKGEGGKMRLAEAKLRCFQPEGDYYVVALTKANPLAKEDKFHYIGVGLIKESSKRIPRGITSEQAKDLEYAEVYSLPVIPQQVRQMLQESVAQALEPPEEYQEYEKIYFLNEVALRMYQDGGIGVEVLKKISAAEMPQQCGRTLSGPYIAKEES